MLNGREKIMMEMAEMANLRIESDGLDAAMEELLGNVLGVDQEKVETEKHQVFEEMVKRAEEMKAQMFEAEVMVQDVKEDSISIVSIEAPLFTINGRMNAKIKECFDFLTTNSDSVNIDTFCDKVGISFTVNGTREARW